MLRKVPFFCLFLVASVVSANDKMVVKPESVKESKAEIEAWMKEYDARFQGQINGWLAKRIEQKAGFAEDVQFTKPDFIAFIPEVEPDKLGDSCNDHFLVFDKPDGTLFAVWCQASCGGHFDQHIAFARSRDKGKTWEKPRVIAGYATVAKGIAGGGNLVGWPVPLVSKSGRIYMLYNEFVPPKVASNAMHTGVMMGMYSDDNGETWTEPVNIPIPRTIYDSHDASIPPEWVVWQKPLRLGKEGRYLVGVTRLTAKDVKSKHRTVTEFIHFDNVDSDPEINDLAVRWIVTDEKALTFDRQCEEPAIVKLPDGRLFSVMRTGAGVAAWSVSTDQGETWSEPKALLFKDGGEEIPHPWSPCPIYDFKGNEAGSGSYLFFAHNKFDKVTKRHTRGPIYLFPGRYQKGAEQPVWFDKPILFSDRPGGNAFYTSLTVTDGKTVLWYPDQKFYLLGKIIDESVFDGRSDSGE